MTISATSEKTLNTLTLTIQGHQKEKRNILKILQTKASQTTERKHLSPGSAENLIQDKPKEENAETHINQRDDN